MTVSSFQPGFGIGLTRDHPFGNADADRGGGGAFAAVRHAQHRLVGRADRRFLSFEGDMGGRGANEDDGAGGAENKLAKHV